MTTLVYGQGMTCDMAEVVTAGSYVVDSIPANGNNTNANADGAVWYQFTPTANLSINVNSCLGGADTRLWVYSGSCDDLVDVANNDDACELAPGGDAYASEVEFLVAAGTTYYIEWDSRWSNDGFTWSITESAIPNDVAVAPLTQFSTLPETQDELWISALNVGGDDVTGVTLTVGVFNTDDLTTPVVSSSSTESIAFNSAAVVNVGDWDPVVGEEYVITYSVSSDDDADDTNNSYTTAPFTVTVNEYRLDDGSGEAGVGLNAGGILRQGNIFTFFADDVIEEVSLSYNGGGGTDSVRLIIHAVDANGLPGALLYEQELSNDPFDGSVELDTPFQGMMGNQYFVGIYSNTSGNIGFSLDQSDATPYLSGQSYFRSGAGAWTDISSIGAFATGIYTIGLFGNNPNEGMSCDMAEVVTAGTYTVDSIPQNGNNTNTNANGAVWYQYTPTENFLVNVNSCLGGADTRLWVYSGTCDDLVNVASNDDACELAPGGDAYASEVEFFAAAGTTYYIEWDDRWSADGFNWELVEQTVPNDVAVAPLTQFAALPETQDELWVSALNVGGDDITGVTLTVEVFDADDLTTPIASGSSDPQDIAFSGVAIANVGSWDPVPGEEYVFIYSVSTDDDANAGNDTYTTPAFVVTESEYRLDDGEAPDNGLGLGAGGILRQGNIFTFFADDTIEEIFVEYTGGDAAGDSIQLIIHEVGADGLPGALLYSQDIDQGPFAGNVVLDTPFEGMMGNQYYIGIYTNTAGFIGFGVDESPDLYRAGQSLFQVNNGTFGDVGGVVAGAIYTVRLFTESQQQQQDIALTLTVGTEFIDVDPDGMFIAGEFSGWTNVAMTDNGDETYSVTVSVMQNDTIEYKFKNGPDGWEEAIPGDCTINGDVGANRFIIVGDMDMSVDEVCFNECVACDLVIDVFDPAFAAGIEVMPNPTLGDFATNFRFGTAKNLNVRLFDAQGRLITERQLQQVTNATERFDLTAQPAGVYNLVVSDGTSVSTKRIVRQ